WNAAIRDMANGADPSEALILYTQMLRRGVPPGKHTFAFLLKACSNSRSAAGCVQVHDHALKLGLDSEFHIVNALVRAYSVCRRMLDARKVFDEMPQPFRRSTSIWTTVICGYSQNRIADETVELFREMVAGGIRPNKVVLSSVLSACAQSSRLDLGKKIHSYINDTGIELNAILGTAIVDMYAKNGELAAAQDCFHRMQRRNIATWNALICGLASHGEAQRAIHYFTTLDLAPNQITLLGVLSACCHAGLLDYGRGIFDSMQSVYGIEPRTRHYGCMVDLLARSGRISEAEQVIRSMGDGEADVGMWGALLSACKEYGDVEGGERAVREILRLDSNSDGVYVVLSNMYAEAGRWDDVVRLRKGMKDDRLKKTCGRSSV
ncbi:hypothetical protein M569_04166, partial [Genlisea aurea]